MKLKYRNLKTALIATTLLPWSAIAQVNMDQPYPVGPSDIVFRSAADSKILYYFPKALIRTSRVDLEVLSGRIRARFEVGMDMKAFQTFRSAVIARDKSLDVRIFRPLDAEVIPASGTDIPDSFDPELRAIGSWDLAGPTPVTLEIDRRYRLIGPDKGKRLLDGIFLAGTRDHVALLQYSFNAIVQGKSASVLTRVAVFAGHRLDPDNGGYAGLLEAAEPAPSRIRTDENCWEDVAPGEFCVRH